MSTVRATVIAPDGNERVLGEVPHAEGWGLGPHFGKAFFQRALDCVHFWLMAAPFAGEVYGLEWPLPQAPNPRASKRAGVQLRGPVVFVELVEQPVAVARG